MAALGPTVKISNPGDRRTIQTAGDPHQGREVKIVEVLPQEEWRNVTEPLYLARILPSGKKSIFPENIIIKISEEDLDPQQG